MMANAPGAHLVSLAAAYARGAHFGDVRKGSGESYFAGHLAPVADIVRRDGGDDVQVAAAYLHDVAEDHGGSARLDDVRAVFGDEVAAIVADLSDSLVDTDAGEVKAPWPERKWSYLAALADKPVSSLAVAAADKLHNASAMLTDHRSIGDELWSRFSTSDPEDHLWYYRTLTDTLLARIPDHPTVMALDEVVTALEVDVRGSAGG